MTPSLATRLPAEVGGRPLLEVRDLRVHIFTKRGVIKAIDGVSLTVRAGEVVGLVGESGSGKTMTCLSILRLLPRGARVVAGQVLFEGVNLLALPDRELRDYRGRRISMVLQDPLTSLNPAFRTGDQVAEVLRFRKSESRRSLRRTIGSLFRSVGVDNPEMRSRSFPHQLSGGMRQRVVSAIAIAPSPVVLLADEPTTSLDVTTQAQYLWMLRRLQQEAGLAVVFITHDLGVVAQSCDRVAVMYAGRIVEEGPVHRIFARPLHPYTKALLSGLPRHDVERKRLPAIPGEPPDLAALPAGCPFAPRCPEALPICVNTYPDEMAVVPDHRVSCWAVPK